MLDGLQTGEFSKLRNNNNSLLFRFSKHKAVFLTGLVLTGCGYFSLQFVPSVSPDLESSLDCSSPWSLLKVMMMMMMMMM